MSKILSNIKQKIENKSDFYTLPYTKDTMKGLSTFINDVRHCKSRVAEVKRVNKELANIRSKFRADKLIDGYHKKKYVAKLIFIHLLGYEVNFGQSEAIYLLCSNKFSEKQIGYLFLSMLPDIDDEQFCKTMVSSISADMRSHNHNFVILAAHCVPNVLCRQIITDIGNDLLDLLRSNNNDHITQSLLSCYLAMIKFDRQYFRQNQALNDYLMRIFVTATDALLLPLTNIFYEGSQMEPMMFSETISGMLSQIQNLTKARHSTGEHVYYGVHSPWTILKLLQCIQAFPIPRNCESHVTAAVISTLGLAKVTNIDLKKIHGPNICNALAFEAINVMAAKPLCSSAITQAVQFLLSALQTSVNNYKYFAMEAMLKIKDLPNAMRLMAPIVPILMRIVTNETNTHLRLKAVDVMYAICEPQMLRSIVDSLMNFLKNCELNIREELTLKISMMSMKVLNDDIQWFVDTMMCVMEYAGQNSSEDIWHKILHVITNNVGVQQYAAGIALNYMRRSNSNDRLVMLSSYILGEFGNQLFCFEGSSAEVQVALLLDFFPFVDISVKYIILTALFKIANRSTEVRQLVTNFLSSDAVTKNIDCEIQQRSCEYVMVLRNFEHMLPAVLDTMPDYVIEEEIGSSTRRGTAKGSLNDDDESYGLGGSNGPPVAGGTIQIPLMKLYDERLKKEGSFCYSGYTIFYESTFSPPSGHIIIKIQSNSSKSSVQRVTNVSFGNHGGLRMKGSTLADAGMLDSIKIDFVCVEAYLDPPIVNIEFLQDARLNLIEMHIPVYVEQFFLPYAADAARFKSIWEGIGPGYDVTAIFQVHPPWSFHNFIHHLVKPLNLQYVPETTPNKLDESYVAVFTAENGQVGCAFHFAVLESQNEVHLIIRTADGLMQNVMADCYNLIFKDPTRHT